MSCHEMTSVVGCHTTALGAQVPVVIHYRHDGAGAPAAYITDVSGAVVPGASLANTQPGACALVADSIKLEAHGGNHASPSLASDYDPDGRGPVWTAPPELQSFTVVVRRAGTIPASPDRVMVTTPSGKYFLTEGDSRSWSVAQHSGRNEVLVDGFTVNAEGDSAFDVIWTVHP